MTLFLSFPGCSHPGLVGFLPLSGVTAPGWSSGRFWLLGAGSRLASPLRSLSPSFSDVGMGGRQSPPCFLTCAEHFGLWPYGLAIAALPRVSRPWTCLCWSHLLSLSSGGSVRGYSAPVGWFRGVSPCFAYCPTSSVLKRSSFGFSASSFALSLRDGVTLSGRVCLSPRSERRLLLHLPGVWLESSRWGHPVGSGLSQISIGTKSFWRTFPGGWCLAFAMGSPISGRVALFCALNRNEGFFLSSILSCFAMGSPCRSSVWFPTLDRNEAGFG